MQAVEYDVLQDAHSQLTAPAPSTNTLSPQCAQPPHPKRLALAPYSGTSTQARKGTQAPLLVLEVTTPAALAISEKTVRPLYTFKGIQK